MVDIPDAVKPFFYVIDSEGWPRCQPDKLRELRDVLRAAEDSLTQIHTASYPAVDALLHQWTGEASDAFRQQWAKLLLGDSSTAGPGYVKSLAAACGALAEACDQTALDVEYTQLTDIAFLIALIVQVIALLAAAFATFGAGAAAAAAAEQATAAAAKALFKSLVQKIASLGFRDIARHLAINLGIEVGVDAGAQTIQMVAEDRENWDLGKTGSAALGGTIGAGVGLVSGALPHGMTRGLADSAIGHLVDSTARTLARGGAENLASTVAEAAATGQLGDLTLGKLAHAAGSGALMGGTGAGHVGRGLDELREGSENHASESMAGDEPPGPDSLSESSGPAPKPDPVEPSTKARSDLEHDSTEVPPSENASSITESRVLSQQPPEVTHAESSLSAKENDGAASSISHVLDGSQPLKTVGGDGAVHPAELSSLHPENRVTASATELASPNLAHVPPSEVQLSSEKEFASVGSGQHPQVSAHQEPGGVANTGTQHSGNSPGGASPVMSANQPGGSGHGPGSGPARDLPGNSPSARGVDAGQGRGPVSGPVIPGGSGGPGNSAHSGRGWSHGSESTSGLEDYGSKSPVSTVDRLSHGPAHDSNQLKPADTTADTNSDTTVDRTIDVDRDLSRMYDDLVDPHYRADSRDFDPIVEHQFATGKWNKVDKQYTELYPETIYRESLEYKTEGMSNEGAYALYSHILGEIPTHMDEKLVRALSSSLNEMPPYHGEVVHAIDHHGDSQALVQTASEYLPGRVVVETRFSRGSAVVGDTPRETRPGEVVFHIQSKTGRDLGLFSSDPSRHEVLFKPGIQLKIEKNTKVSYLDPSGKETVSWVIQAKELVEGDPEFLDPDAAKQRIESRQQKAIKIQGEKSRSSDRESDAKPANARRSDEPKGGWGALNTKVRKLLSVPAIHAANRTDSGPVSVRMQFLMLRKLFGGLSVNPLFYSPEVAKPGYRQNHVESVLAFEKTLQGVPVTAEPAESAFSRSFVLNEKGSSDLARLRSELPGDQDWLPCPKGMASAVEYLAGQPVGSRAALVYDFRSEGGKIHQYAAVAVNTEHGVVLIDPTRNRLLQIPQNLIWVNILPYHIGDGRPLMLNPHEARIDRTTDVDRYRRQLDRDLVDPDFHARKADYDRVIENQLETLRYRRGDSAELMAEYLFRESLNQYGESVSRFGSYAVHSYFHDGLSEGLNEKLATGGDLADNEVHQIRAISSGLNELPTYHGDAVLSFDFQGNDQAAVRMASNYLPGRVTVEPAFIEALRAEPNFRLDVESGEVAIFIKSSTGRIFDNVSDGSLSQSVLFKPDIQLRVIGNQKVSFLDPSGLQRTKWIIRAEELAPGDSRRLSAETAQRVVAERRIKNAAGIAHRISETQGQESTKKRISWEEITEKLKKAPYVQARTSGFSKYGVSIGSQVRILHKLYGGTGVNPEYYAPDSIERGFRHNTIESLIALEKHIQGEEAFAGPAQKANQIGAHSESRTRDEYLEDLERLQKGVNRFSTWKYDLKNIVSAINYMAAEPLGSRAALVCSFDFQGKHHEIVGMLLTTEYGVVLVDPMRNRLLDIPGRTIYTKGVAKVDFLPYYIGSGQPMFH